jgi:hypothetical protein
MNFAGVAVPTDTPCFVTRTSAKIIRFVLSTSIREPRYCIVYPATSYDCPGLSVVSLSMFHDLPVKTRNMITIPRWTM